MGASLARLIYLEARLDDVITFAVDFLPFRGRPPKALSKIALFDKLRPIGTTSEFVTIVTDAIEAKIGFGHVNLHDSLFDGLIIQTKMARVNRTCEIF